MKKLMSRAFWAGAGAGTAYLLDPDRGRSRRARLTDQARARLRRAGREAEREARGEAGAVQGRARQATTPDQPPADDRALVDRIKSEVLPRHQAGEVVVDAVGGEVTLRGQMASSERMAALVSAVAAVPGVARVVELLHLPGEEAPNKQAALRAS